MPSAEIVANSLTLRGVMLIVEPRSAMVAVEAVWELGETGMGRRTVNYMGLN